MATFRSALSVPTDIITYRLSEKLVYVRPAENYEQAIDVAQKEFPEELGHVPRERITFSIAANINGGRKHVRISESAWGATVARLLRGEIIELQIRPDSSEKDTPPLYSEVSGKHSNQDTKPRRKSHSVHSQTPSSKLKSHKPKGFFGFQL